MQVSRFSVLIVSGLLWSCESKPAGPVAVAETKVAPQPEVKPQRTTAALTRVNERNKVCMVNDQYMGRDQIPVTVEGKAYFGCCPMCEDRLKRDSAIRAAIDPVTRHVVDKALAVIGKTESGKVLYFENVESFQRYGGS